MDGRKLFPRVLLEVGRQFLGEVQVPIIHSILIFVVLCHLGHLERGVDDACFADKRTHHIVLKLDLVSEIRQRFGDGWQGTVGIVNRLAPWASQTSSCILPSSVFSDLTLFESPHR